MHSGSCVRRRVCLEPTLTILFAWLVGGTAAIAADQTILGKRLVIADPGVATKRKVVCTAREPLSPNTLVGDPSVEGGVLEVIANGGTPSAQSFTLPQGTTSKGRPFWSGTAATVFKIEIAEVE